MGQNYDSLGFAVVASMSIPKEPKLYHRQFGDNFVIDGVYTGGMKDRTASLPYHNYASFLLRLWQKRNDQEDVWIASLQSTATGEAFAFQNIEAFIRFLQTHFMAGQSLSNSLEQDGQNPQEHADAQECPEEDEN